VSGEGAARFILTYPKGFGKVNSVSECSFTMTDGKMPVCDCKACFTTNGYETKSVVTFTGIHPTMTSSPAVIIKFMVETLAFKFSGVYDSPCGPVKLSNANF
jgi:hypothetical protein